MACRRITHSGSPCRGRAAGTTGTSTAGNRTWAASAGKSHTVCWYLRSSSGAASKSSARDRGCRPPRREGPRNRPHRNGGVPTPLSERGPKASSQVAPQLAAVDARDRERPSTVSVRRPSSGAASKSSSRDRVGADPVGRGLEIVLTKSGVPAGGSVPHPPERVPGAHAFAARYFGRPKLRPEKSPRRRTTSRRCSGACRRSKAAGQADQDSLRPRSA
jgi:hypothetical protein